ncbi:hypothetical protein NMY22_g2665 [Coprinellus aureogranulatus]|nr:hypothetical protein NMY22_g2665 [Coprinellus aureogranulatus]
MASHDRCSPKASSSVPLSLCLKPGPMIPFSVGSSSGLHEYDEGSPLKCIVPTDDQLQDLPRSYPGAQSLGVLDDGFLASCALPLFTPGSKSPSNTDLLFTLCRFTGPGITKFEFRRIMRQCDICFNICFAERTSLHRCQAKLLLDQDKVAWGDFEESMLSYEEHAGFRCSLSMVEVYDRDRGNQPWSQLCVCGKQFMQPNSYSLHTTCCTAFKAQLAERLRSARQLRAMRLDDPVSSGSRKRSRLSWYDEQNLDVDPVMNPTTRNPIQREVQFPPGSGSPTQGPVHTNDFPDGSANRVGEVASEELGRGLRTRKLPDKIRRAANVQPSSALPLSLFGSLFTVPDPPPINGKEAATPSACPSSSPEVIMIDKPPPRLRRTAVNPFGLYKAYTLYSDDIPHDPDSSAMPSDLREDAGEVNDLLQDHRSLYPFPNINSFRLSEWFWSDEHEKSQRSFDQLREIIGCESFNPTDIREANWAHIDRVLAASQFDDEGLGAVPEDSSISWITTSVRIDVPISKTFAQPGSYSFEVPGFHYRPLVPVIKEKLASSTGQEYFHTLGSELRWKPGATKEDVRVYGEIYNSPVFIQAYEEIQNLPPEKDCDLPRYVIGLMFSSDATMLATFGSAKLWPLYLCFGNDSKYRRAKPSERLFETIAYFEKLPDNFKDFLGDLTSRSTANKNIVTHCQRELFHQQWKHLLDEEFVQAYCHGIVVECNDGAKRRFYPRILTYSADYPEKVRLVRKDDEDRRRRVSESRRLIYDKNYSLISKAVDARLFEQSLVASDNAFSATLSPHGFDLFKMLVVDVMHEVELGVWKAVFMQLLRLLDATDKGSINTLDMRYANHLCFAIATELAPQGTVSCQRLGETPYVALSIMSVR